MTTGPRPSLVAGRSTAASFKLPHEGVKVIKREESITIQVARNVTRFECNDEVVKISEIEKPIAIEIRQARRATQG